MCMIHARMRITLMRWRPWRARAPGVLAPLVYSVFLTIRNLGWYFDAALVCHATNLKESLFILRRSLVHFELFSCLF